MAQRPAITAIILCGGRGTRLGGVDKPLLEVGDKALLGHVIDRVHPQVDALVLSCAKTTSAYEAFGHPVVADRDATQGPLGGFVSALPQARTPWVLTTPADTPFLPENLVAALAAECDRAGAAVATAGGHRQNLVMLLDADHARSLAAFYEAGGRAIHRWLVANAVPEVGFSADEFLNVNTPEDLATALRNVASP